MLFKKYFYEFLDLMFHKKLLMKTNLDFNKRCQRKNVFVIYECDLFFTSFWKIHEIIQNGLRIAINLFV